MQRVLFIAALLIAVVVGGRALRYALASDETKIGWMFADEVEAFASASLLRVTPHFAADFRDSTAGIDQQTLRAAVVWVWQNRRNADGRFAWHVEMPGGIATLSIDGDKATATFPLELHKGDDDRKQLLWRLDVTAQLERRDGDWTIVQSTHETVAGGRPR